MEARKRRRLLIATGLAAMLLILLGCRILLGPSDDELQGIRQALQGEQALVVDVRSPGEFADGHLRGAVNVPVGGIGDRLAELGAKDRPLVVY